MEGVGVSQSRCVWLCGCWRVSRCQTGLRISFFFRVLGLVGAWFTLLLEIGFKEAALVNLLQKVSDFFCVGYVCLECDTVLLASVQMTIVCVDVLVWRVNPGGVENRLDVYALGAGDDRPGPDVCG